MLKLCSCPLSIFLSLAGLLIPSLAIAQKQASVDVPPKSRLSCDEAIANVKDDLTQRGFLLPLPSRRGESIPTVSMDKTYIPQYFFDYPSDRTERVMFVLREVTDLYNSPKLMATLASQIMSDCNKVGMVSFARWQEGLINVGFFSDNTAKTFINVIDVRTWEVRSDMAYTLRDSKYQWGFYSSF